MEDNEFIHICMGLHDPKGTYSVNVMMVMYSVITNTSSRVMFHIFIDDSVSEENKNAMRRILTNTNHSIEFCDVNMEEYNIQGDFVELYTVGALMRLLIPNVLTNLHKVIYMDADLLVNRDVSELWNVDISEVALAGTRDTASGPDGTGKVVIESGYVKAEEYINSGVLLMNLDKIRESGVLVEQTAEFLRNNSQSFWPDQDALNYIYRDSKKMLDECWNVLTTFERKKTQWIRKAVYHFAGDHFFWNNVPTEFDMRLQFVKVMVTGDYGIIEESRKVIASLTDHIRLNQKILSIVSRRNVKCIFYGQNSGAMNNLVNMVGTKYGDYFVLDNEAHDDSQAEGIPTLAFDEISREVRGSFVVFVAPWADHDEAISKLQQLGLKRDEDFFVVPCVMTAAQGGYLY